jgi:hypothetical protein
MTHKCTEATHTILITGDSHAQGIASKIKHNQEKEFEIQGFMKLGSDLAAVTNTVTRDTGTLTNDDDDDDHGDHDDVYGGGTKDIGRNETWKGLCQTSSFVSKHSQTNILVINVHNRFDLAAQSCVNYEGKFFNRKLGKHVKSFYNASTVELKPQKGPLYERWSPFEKQGERTGCQHNCEFVNGDLEANKEEPHNCELKRGTKVRGS